MSADLRGAQHALQREPRTVSVATLPLAGLWADYTCSFVGGFTVEFSPLFRSLVSHRDSPLSFVVVSFAVPLACSLGCDDCFAYVYRSIAYVCTTFPSDYRSLNRGYTNRRRDVLLKVTSL